MLIELALITGAYCLLVAPAIAALEGIIEGKVSSDIKLGKRRHAVILETEKLQQHFNNTTGIFKRADNTKPQEVVHKKKKRKHKKKKGNKNEVVKYKSGDVVDTYCIKTS